ncbi:hypothetical protein BDZ89DRAFT_1140082 [Hymenopellis radicata]|nr:hypothetical protein BDZ89DRAFT_1140082 [Hymenopellis radicata]
MPSLELPPISLVQHVRLAHAVLDLEEVVNDLAFVAAWLRHDLADMGAPESWSDSEETTATLADEINRLHIGETNDGLGAPNPGRTVAVTADLNGVASRYETTSYEESQMYAHTAKDMSEFAKLSGNSLVEFTQDHDETETVAFRKVVAQQGAPQRVSSSCGGYPFRRPSAVELEDVFWDKRPWRGRACPLPKRRRDDDTDETVKPFTNRRRTT